MGDLYLGFELCLHFLTDHIGRNSELFMQYFLANFVLTLKSCMNVCHATSLGTLVDFYGQLV